MLVWLGIDSKPARKNKEAAMITKREKKFLIVLAFVWLTSLAATQMSPMALLDMANTWSQIQTFKQGIKFNDGTTQTTAGGSSSGSTVFTSGLQAADARMGASPFVVNTDKALTMADMGKTFVVSGTSPVAVTFTVANITSATGWMVNLADGVPDSGISIVATGQSVWYGVGPGSGLASSIFTKPGSGNSGFVTQIWATYRAGAIVIKVIDPNTTWLVGKI
jgi:hypothetical protein